MVLPSCKSMIGSSEQVIVLVIVKTKIATNTWHPLLKELIWTNGKLSTSAELEMLPVSDLIFQPILSARPPPDMKIQSIESSKEIITRKTHCFGHYCIWPSLVDGFELDPRHLSVLGGSHGMAVPGISDLSVPGMVSIFSKFLIQLIHHFYFVPGVVCRLFLYLHGGGQRCKHHHDQQGLAKVPTFGTGEKSNTKRSKTGESSSVIYLCLCILARKKTERRAMARWTGGRKVTMKTMFLLLSWTRCDWAEVEN